MQAMEKVSDIKLLRLMANILRQDVIRMVAEARSGHPGGAIGLAEIFTVLYFNILKHDPKNPEWEERDRLVLSNGHVCAVMYAAMARSGYFPVEELMTFRRLGSRLQGHPATIFLPGLETSSGSLGHGLAQAVGIALASRGKGYRIYCSLSDGECQEGGTWEAALHASHYKLGNLTAFVDRNFIQLDGPTEEIMSLEPLGEKFKSFGWEVFQEDGHDVEGIIRAFNRAKSVTEKPSVILFRTTLGKGVSFMENNHEWHGKPPSPEEARKALQDLAEERRKIEG